MCVSSSSTTFVWNIFHYKKNWARYGQKGILVFMYSTRRMKFVENIKIHIL